MQHEKGEEWKFDMTWTKLNHYSSSRLQLFFKIECSRSGGSHWRCSLRCWGLHACNFIKKRLQQRCFPVNIAKILRTAFFKEHLGRLLLRVTLSWLRPLSYRNQSIDLRSKSIDWFLYDNDLRHERVNHFFFLLDLLCTSICRLNF